MAGSCTDTLPRLKLKRPQAAKAYRGDLDALYEEVVAAEQQKAKL